MISFFEIWISLKYLFPKTKEKFFSAVTLFSFLVEEVSADEEEEEKREGAIDEEALLASSHGVGAEPVTLVLLEASHLLAHVLELGLIRTARGTFPVLGKILELRPRGDGVEVVTPGWNIGVHAALALVLARPVWGKVWGKKERVCVKCVREVSDEEKEGRSTESRVDVSSRGVAVRREENRKGGKPSS